jgi:4-carboxymuconolactone decarboxylase
VSESANSKRHRFPSLDASEMSLEQAEAVAEIVAGPRGAFGGPFVPLLRSPRVLRHLQALGEELRFHSSAEQRLVEFVILLVSRRWDQTYEWAAHTPLALAAGISMDTIQSIAKDERPGNMDTALDVVWQVFTELDNTHGVSDDTFVTAKQLVGEAALIELVAAMGYYTTLAFVINTAQLPPRSAAPVALIPTRPAV